VVLALNALIALLRSWRQQVESGVVPPVAGSLA
jgi:hypothetical protein